MSKTELAFVACAKAALDKWREEGIAEFAIWDIGKPDTKQFISFTEAAGIIMKFYKFYKEKGGVENE